MKVEKASQKLETVRQHSQALQQKISAAASLSPREIPPLLEEMIAVMEKLHHAEAELQQQHEELLSTRQVVEIERQRYQDLFEFAPDGYVVTDADGVIREANRATVALLGIAHGFLVGKPLTNLVAPRDRRALRRYVTQLCQHAPPQPEWEVWLQPRHSTLVSVALTVAVVRDAQGKVVNLRWLLRDSTARKRAEEEVRQAKDATEAANRAKSEFLATMSHELRTPLHIILGYTELLAEGEFGVLSTEGATVVRRVKRSATELGELLTALLDLNRLEAKQWRVKKQRVDAATLLEEVRADTQNTWDTTRLNFVWDICAPLPLLYTDVGKLKIVLKNLIGNAIKFTQRGSVTVAASTQDEGVEFEVSDTGCGIPPEMVAVIFEPFRQVENSFTPEEGGVGLGLHIVHRLLHLLEGRITVDSAVGRGSTFRVWIPTNGAASHPET